MTRNPEAVRRDVLDSKVSPQAARESYGVVLLPGSLDIDREATRQRRVETKLPTKDDEEKPKINFISEKKHRL